MCLQYTVVCCRHDTNRVVAVLVTGHGVLSKELHVRAHNAFPMLLIENAQYESQLDKAKVRAVLILQTMSCITMMILISRVEVSVGGADGNLTVYMVTVTQK